MPNSFRKHSYEYRNAAPTVFALVLRSDYENHLDDFGFDSGELVVGSEVQVEIGLWAISLPCMLLSDWMVSCKLSVCRQTSTDLVWRGVNSNPRDQSYVDRS